MYENEISCTLNGIIRGLVMFSDIYQSLYSPLLLKNYFTPIKGGAGMAPCALSYASDGGAARICQRGGGGKARERSDRAGEGVGGDFPLPR